MDNLANQEEKRAFILLNAIIFHYHGLDENEEKILLQIAKDYQAEPELLWAYDFISKDYLNAFERARTYLNKAVKKLEKNKRLDFINFTWQANLEKGYITEMEATAMLKLARDWEVDKDLIGLVQQA